MVMVKVVMNSQDKYSGQNSIDETALKCTQTICQDKDTKAALDFTLISHKDQKPEGCTLLDENGLTDYPNFEQNIAPLLHGNSTEGMHEAANFTCGDSAVICHTANAESSTAVSDTHFTTSLHRPNIKLGKPEENAQTQEPTTISQKSCSFNVSLKTSEVNQERKNTVSKSPECDEQETVPLTVLSTFTSNLQNQDEIPANGGISPSDHNSTDTQELPNGDESSNHQKLGATINLTSDRCLTSLNDTNNNEPVNVNIGNNVVPESGLCVSWDNAFETDIEKFDKYNKSHNTTDTANAVQELAESCQIVSASDNEAVHNEMSDSDGNIRHEINLQTVHEGTQFKKITDIILPICQSENSIANISTDEHIVLQDINLTTTQPTTEQHMTTDGEPYNQELDVNRSADFLISTIEANYTKCVDVNPSTKVPVTGQCDCTTDTCSVIGLETPEAELVEFVPEGAEPVKHLPKEAEPVEHLPKEAEPVGHIPKEAEPVKHLPKKAEPVEHLPKKAEPVEHLPKEAEPVEHLPKGAEPVEYVLEEERSYFPEECDTSQVFSSIHQHSTDIKMPCLSNNSQDRWGINMMEGRIQSDFQNKSSAYERETLPATALSPITNTCHKFITSKSHSLLDAGDEYCVPTESKEVIQSQRIQLQDVHKEAMSSIEQCPTKTTLCQTLDISQNVSLRCKKDIICQPISDVIDETDMETASVLDFSLQSPEMKKSDTSQKSLSQKDKIVPQESVETDNYFQKSTDNSQSLSQERNNNPENKPTVIDIQRSKEGPETLPQWSTLQTDMCDNSTCAVIGQETSEAESVEFVPEEETSLVPEKSEIPQVFSSIHQHSTDIKMPHLSNEEAEPVEHLPKEAEPVEFVPEEERSLVPEESEIPQVFSSIHQHSTDIKMPCLSNEEAEPVEYVPEEAKQVEYVLEEERSHVPEESDTPQVLSSIHQHSTDIKMPRLSNEEAEPVEDLPKEAETVEYVLEEERSHVPEESDTPQVLSSIHQHSTDIKMPCLSNEEAEPVEYVPEEAEPVEYVPGEERSHVPEESDTPQVLSSIHQRSTDIKMPCLYNEEAEPVEKLPKEAEPVEYVLEEERSLVPEESDTPQVFSSIHQNFTDNEMPCFRVVDQSLSNNTRDSKSNFLQLNKELKIGPIAFCNAANIISHQYLPQKCSAKGEELQLNRKCFKDNVEKPVNCFNQQQSYHGCERGHFIANLDFLVLNKDSPFNKIKPKDTVTKVQEESVSMSNAPNVQNGFNRKRVITERSKSELLNRLSFKASRFASKANEEDYSTEEVFVKIPIDLDQQEDEQIIENKLSNLKEENMSNNIIDSRELGPVLISFSPTSVMSVSPKAESVSPGADSVSQGVESLSTGAESVCPEVGSVSPEAESVSPGAESVSPGDESVSQGFESLSTGAESVCPEAESVCPEAESVSPEAESVSPVTKSFLPSMFYEECLYDDISPIPTKVRIIQQECLPSVVIPDLDQTVPENMEEQDPYMSLQFIKEDSTGHRVPEAEIPQKISTTLFNWQRMGSQQYIIPALSTEINTEGSSMLPSVTPLKTCSKPRRVGLSRRQRTQPLHSSLNKPYCSPALHQKFK